MAHAARNLLAQAMQQHRAGRLSDAERSYQEILTSHPRHPDALHFLGVLALQTGRHGEAVQFIERAIAENNQVPAFHNNLGNVHLAQGHALEAADCYRRALRLQPNHIDAHYNLGVAWQGLGRLADALQEYRHVLALKPDHVDAHINLGNTLHALGQLNEAAAIFERAVALWPTHADALSNWGATLKSQGKLEEAEALYRRAIATDPKHVAALNNLGMLLLERDDPDQASIVLERAVQQRATADAWTNLGHARRELGRMRDAESAYGRALAAEPDHAEARLGLACATIPLLVDTAADGTAATVRFAHSLEDYARWAEAHLDAVGNRLGSVQPFYLAYRPADTTGLLSRYGAIACAAAAATATATARRPAAVELRAPSSPRDRIRLVVVCGHVRHHPVWDVILRGLIVHRDRQRVELIVYHTGSLTDDETAWAARSVDRFVQGPKPIASWLEEMRADAPDVIFYPEVGMDPAVFALAAHKLAPLQVASWGHPITTGLPTIDLFLSGEHLECPHAQSHYSERLIRLPASGVVIDTEIHVPLAPRPHRPVHTVRFALCQQPIKFDPADDALLVRIAQAAGPCEFWLAEPKRLRWAAAQLQARLATAFRAGGLEPERYLRMTPWLSQQQFAAFLDTMDVYLDCPAFSGYTTAMQAAGRGLPIVTLEGEFLRQRLAAGVLRTAGMTDGIATSPNDYVERAVRYADQSRVDSNHATRQRLQEAIVKAIDPGVIRAFELTIIDALPGR